MYIRGMKTTIITTDKIMADDVIAYYGALLKVTESKNFGFNERTGADVWVHKIKRIDPKPWDPYFSDILNDDFSIQGNYRATWAKVLRV